MSCHRGWNSICHSDSQKFGHMKDASTDVEAFCRSPPKFHSWSCPSTNEYSRYHRPGTVSRYSRSTSTCVVSLVESWPMSLVSKPGVVNDVSASQSQCRPFWRSNDRPPFAPCNDLRFG